MIALAQFALKIWSAKRVLTLDLNHEPSDEAAAIDLRTVEPVPGPDS